MIKKRTINLKRYAFLSNEDKELIDYTIVNSLKPNPILRVGWKKRKPKQIDFWKLSGNDIVLLRHHISKHNIRAVHQLLYNISDKEFLKLDVFNCSACFKWACEQIKKINETENQELGDEPSIEDKNAGIERLSEYGYSVWVHQLSNGDITKEDEILKMPYSRIFKKRCLMYTLSDIQKQKQENARRKNKRVNR